MNSWTGFIVLTASAIAHARTFTVKNNCLYPVWPAIFTDPNVGTDAPDQATGWEAAPGSSVSFYVPDDWRSGRIWGRRNCDFSTNPGAGACLDGGCNGGLLCDPHSGTGVPPATVAEFTLGGGSGGADWYDVSLVDGYNLPVQIDNNQGCHVAGCPVDLIPNCPAPLRGPFDTNGNAVGCKSACGAGLAPDPDNSSNCCTGSHGVPETCPPSGVQYYAYFKDNCPDSYAYAYDENSGTALWQCDSGLAADYTITFCPSASTAPPPPPPPPPSNGVHQLHPNGNKAKCLDVRSNNVTNGTPVQIYDCNGTGAQNWVINSGSASVQLAGTNYCLDAGCYPSNSGRMRIWQCYAGHTAQTWTYSSDNQISLQSQDLCLDLTDGSTTNGNVVQTWACVDGNANQKWTE